MAGRCPDAKRDSDVVVLRNGHVQNPITALVGGHTAALLDDERDRGSFAHEMYALGHQDASGLHELVDIADDAARGEHAAAQLVDHVGQGLGEGCAAMQQGAVAVDGDGVFWDGKAHGRLQEVLQGDGVQDEGVGAVAHGVAQGGRRAEGGVTGGNLVAEILTQIHAAARERGGRLPLVHRKHHTGDAALLGADSIIIKRGDADDVVAVQDGV